jgi:hypothetical protein
LQHLLFLRRHDGYFLVVILCFGRKLS